MVLLGGNQSFSVKGIKIVIFSYPRHYSLFNQISKFFDRLKMTDRIRGIIELFLKV